MPVCDRERDGCVCCVCCVCVCVRVCVCKYEKGNKQNWGQNCIPALLDLTSFISTAAARQTKKPLGHVRAHTDTIMDLQFSSDYLFMITASKDHTAKV